MKQTAVEWLMENLHTAKDPFTQAKEMEKQMVIDIVEKSRATGLTAEYLLLTYGSKGSDDHVPDVRKMVEDDNYLTPVDWLMDRIKWIHRETYDYLIKEGQYDVAKRTENAILDKANEIQSSQTEISDEEWKKIVKEINKQPMIFVPNEISDEEIKNIVDEIYPNANGSSKLLVSGFIQGCRWYREQLKKKQ